MHSRWKEWLSRWDCLMHAQEMKSRCLVKGKDLRSLGKLSSGKPADDLNFQDRVFDTNLVNSEETLKVFEGSHVVMTVF